MELNIGLVIGEEWARAGEEKMGGIKGQGVRTLFLMRKLGTGE